MKKLRCAILDDYQKVALKLGDWSTIGDQVEVIAFDNHFTNEDELIAAINHFEIVMINRERTPFTAMIFQRLPHLKLLLTAGPRNAAIDLAAAKEHGVIVCGTQGFLEPPCELTWLLILGLAKNLIQEYTNLRNDGPWQSSVGIDLFGKRLGILGLGNVGSKVAKVGLAFGMDVIAWSDRLTTQETDKIGIKLAASKAELLKTSDFITIHLVLVDSTRNLIDAAEFKLMKPSAFLINTSRAEIINEQALIHALENNLIAGVGLDVYYTEPLPQGNIFRKLPHLLATPHIGYVTFANYRAFFQDAVEDIKAYLNGAPIRVIN